MESDDDFLPPTQFSTQHRGSNRQAVTSTSRSQAWDRPGPSRPSQFSQSQGRSIQSQCRPSQEEELSQIQDGIKFLMERVQQLTGDSRGIKRPAEPKPFDKKPDTKEQCQLCKKYYANKTTLFRHYRAMHGEMHPEKYHGCSVNSTVVSLDTSFRENTCSICGYVAASQNALDTHNRDVHGNVVNTFRVTCSICGYAAASQNALDTHNRDVHGNVASNNPNRALANVNSGNDVNTDVACASNKENISNNAINKLHKCETCACYFEERNKFDEHMKAQHGYQFVCHICNKHLLFKDVDAHVKEVHPDVYKDNKEKNEKVIVEKMMRNAKGNRVRVFICTKCGIKMVDKIEAEKHARGHKKGLKIKVAPRVQVTKAKDNITDMTLNAHVIFTCEVCDISTGSYDVAVEHAQNHKTNNLNDIVTQQCLICELKFEPLCYKHHVDLHYKNKEIHKESFRYFKYRPQVLLYEDCFSKEPELKKITDNSIYRHTRTVRMRVMQEGTYNLYKCCQCDNFVEPSAVHNHAINYDTCVKVKCSYTCDICDRKFNNKLARNNHAKDHKSEENYKTVLFNHENDKEFNIILNSINDSGARTVLYKCLCGLCFVKKENAEIHLKRCPGKDKKTLCPKCNNFFNSEELLAHCIGQHSDLANIITENITPDVIVIDEDEESENNLNNHADIIEIDDDEAPTELKIEVLTNGDAETGSSEEADNRNRSASGVLAEADENEQLASEGNLLIAKSERDIDEEEDRCHEDFDGTDDMTDDDSQDTINYEDTVTATDVVNHVMTKEKVKCVPTNLLLNPLHFKKKADVLNADLTEITASITSINQELETTRALSNVLIDTIIKNEESWFDPTNFSNIRSRPSLRHPAPSNLIQDIVDLLLTDDEETEINHDEGDTEINENIRTEENNDTLNEVSENNDMREDVTNKTSNTTITEQIQNVGTEDINDIQPTLNNEDNVAIIQNEGNNIEELARENNVNVEAQPEPTTMNGQGITDDSTRSHEEAVNNDQNYSEDEDDLFIPSGIVNREKSRNTELSKEVPNKDQLATQVDSGNKSQYDNNIEETEVESANDTSESHNIEKSGGISVENPQNNTEINDIRSDETNDIHNIEPAGTEIDKETNVSTEHVQTNYDEVTQEYVEFTLKKTTEIAENEVRESISEKQTVNIKKEFSYADINIKRELIEENVQESENVSEREVKIKPEPIDYIENKESDIFVINNVDNVNYNHCSIC